MGRSVNNTPENRKIIQGMCLLDDEFMTVFFDNNPECVQEILNVLMPVKVTVESVKTQYKYKNPNGRTVTFDIHATDENNKVYNIEMQRRSDGAIPQRARYHSSMLDTKALQETEDFKEIDDTYVIFITEYDVLKGKKPVYCIERMILNPDEKTEEQTGRLFNDGSHIIYLNTAFKGECRIEIKNLIHDLRCIDSDEIINEVLAKRTERVKKNPTEKEEDTMCDLIQERVNAEISAIQERADREISAMQDKISAMREEISAMQEKSDKEIAAIQEKADKERAEGILKQAMETAEKMLSSGDLPVEKIAEYCSLSVDQVRALAK